MTVERLLIIGQTGQLPSALARRAGELGVRATALGRPDLDLLDPDAARRTIAEIAPSHMINAAAFTAVDRAETEEAAAFALNAEAAGVVAETAESLGARLVHVSTDYVFDGRKGAPYAEADDPAPLNAYGRSKLAGEVAVSEAFPDAAIVRTSAVFSGQAGNFVSAIARRALAREPLRVIDDNATCPTYAEHLAHGLLALCEVEDARGVFHLCGAPAVSWAELAREILDRLASRGYPTPTLEAVPTRAYPTPAARPADSRLEDTRLKPLIGDYPRRWRNGLDEALDAILASCEMESR